MKPHPYPIREEIFRNKQLMSYNVALTLSEQNETDTLTITPHMFDRLLSSDRYRPIIFQGLQEQVDEWLKDNNYFYFGRVWKIMEDNGIDEPRPGTVDLNILIPGVTELPCPQCDAYNAVKNTQLNATIHSIDIEDIKDQVVTIYINGVFRMKEDGKESIKINLYGRQKGKFWLEDDFLYFSIEDIDVSSDYETSYLMFDIKFKHNYIRITNNFWYGGTCWRFPTGIESMIIKEFGTQKLNIRPYIDGMLKSEDK